MNSEEPRAPATATGPWTARDAAAGLFVACVLLAAAQEGGEKVDAGAAARVDFAAEVKPLFERTCFTCHGPEKQKSDVRLDVLDPDMVDGPDAHAWHVALDMIQSGEMPPRKGPQLTDDERRLVVRWMTESLREAALASAGERSPVLRRLNREQYSYTLQELLGVSIDFGRVLPGDGKSRMGFTNSGEVLQASPLHLDYYRALARQALDQAIAVGGRPAVTHYRVTFGKGIGAGLPAGDTGGYQSVPLSTDDFVVEILDDEGRPRAGADAGEQAVLDGIKRRISVGLRGSGQNRFRVVEEGMLLYAALPHREVVPQAWQGPSPNLKLEMQRVFPETGDFVMRVRASRGYLLRTQEPVLVSLEDPAPRVTLVDGEVRVPEGSQVLSAAESDERSNLVLREDALVPEDRTLESSARVQVDLPEEGYYQVDLVHPPVPPDAMPSVRLSFGPKTLDMRPELSAEELAEARVATTVGAAYLRKGRHHLKVGGPFFAGFSHLVVTPLPEEHALVQRLSARTDELERSLLDKLPAIRAYVGTRTDDGMDYKCFDRPQEVRAPLGAAETYTFQGRLENLPIPEPDSGDTEVLSGFMLLGLWNDHLVKSPNETGPPLLVEAIEFEAPYHPVWPPASHAAIFFECEQRGDEERYTREVLARFLGRAFRRPLEEGELATYLDFWRAVKDEYEHYEHGVREVLVAALCTPSFLYLAEPADAVLEDGTLADDALATRLSYFLWSSPPDDELRALAASGRLRAELDAQVDRLLDDPRAWRFVRAFGREWLRLDRLEDMTVDVNAFPAFTRFVKRDMAEETYQFLHRVLSEDLDLFTLVDSDFAMLNQNLAEFYGIAGVSGPDFRPVPVPRERGRGGLLSQGAFLTGHSDGNQPHPIKRAVWIKEKILGDPPMPPPPNVPDLDPDAPGFEGLTLKEQLEAHRNKASCVDCHRGIDPYGVVFEGYNAVGLFQDERKGRPVDTRSTLPDGTEVGGVAELKAYIRERVPEAFASSVIEHLYAYALGRDLHFGDEEVLREILERVESEGYRMRSVIRAIVGSRPFTHR